MASVPMYIIEDKISAIDFVKKNCAFFDPFMGKEYKSFKYFEKYLSFSDMTTSAKNNTYLGNSVQTAAQTCINLGRFMTILGYKNQAVARGAKRPMLDEHSIYLINDTLEQFSKNNTSKLFSKLGMANKKISELDFLDYGLTTKIEIAIGAHGIGAARTNIEFEKVRKNLFIGDKLILIETSELIEDDKQLKKSIYVIFVRNKKYNEIFGRIDSKVTNIDGIEEFYKKSKTAILSNANLGTEKISKQKQRVGQDEFRKTLLDEVALYDAKQTYKCAVCDLIATNKTMGILIASHIVPWRDALREERVDLSNGLLLCRNHDYLFDKHFIGFDPNKSYELVVSDEITDELKKGIKNLPQCLLTDNRKEYLAKHFEKLK